MKKNHNIYISLCYLLYWELGAYYFLKSQFHENAIKNVLNTDSNELQKN